MDTDSFRGYGLRIFAGNCRFVFGHFYTVSAVADVLIVEIFDKEGFFLVARNVFTSGDLIVPGL